MAIELTPKNNEVTIVGKLLSATFSSGTRSNGQPYERGTFVVRVNQEYSGKQEISEITVPIFASQFTRTGAPSKTYTSLQEAKTLNAAQDVGEDQADIVRISGANLEENYFMGRNGFVDDWRIRGAFIRPARSANREYAVFDMDAYILNMGDEFDRENEPTGRLQLKVGVIQFGGRLDVLDLYVEDPEYVSIISRSWNIDDTVHVSGVIRETSTVEEEQQNNYSTFGQTAPRTRSVFRRELIVTGGSEEPFDESMAFDQASIKKAFNVRKANIEQVQTNGAVNAAKPKPKSKYSFA